MEDSKDILLILIKITFYFLSCYVFYCVVNSLNTAIWIILTVSFIILLAQTRVYINITLNVCDYFSIIFCLFVCYFCFETQPQAAQAGLRFTTKLRLALNSWSSCLSRVLGLQVCATTPGRLHSHVGFSRYSRTYNTNF